MNLGSPDNASNCRPFLDLLLTASDWSREGGLYDPAGLGVTVGPRGWPMGLTGEQQVFVRLGGSQGGDFPGVTLPPESRLQPGRYEFRLTGRGAIQEHLFYADGTADQPVTIVDGAATIAVDVARPVGAYLGFDILQSDPADPLTPESFRPVGSSGLWNPVYTDPLRIFPTLRTMDLQVTNDSTLTDAFPDHYTVATNTGSGPPPEWLGELSAATGADLWVNAPDTYSERLVREQAERIKSTLPPGRKLVVESSNETWNSSKQQYHRLMALGRAAYPGLSDLDALLRYSARRAKAVHEIFADVLGEDRIVRVLGGLQIYTYPAEVMFDEYVDVLGGPPPDLALGGYIGWNFGQPANRDATIALGPDGLRQALLDGPFGVPAAASSWELHRPLRERYGVKLHVYEGGPHLRQEGGGPDDLDLIRLFKAVSDDPGPCCAALLDAADEHGVDRFCWFNYTGTESRQGFWPVFQWTGQPSTKKYLALGGHAMPKPDPPKPRTFADLVAVRDECLAARTAAQKAFDDAQRAATDRQEELRWSQSSLDAAESAVDAATPNDRAVLLADGTAIVPPSDRSRRVPTVKADDLAV